jgi:hypothetical protein
VLCQSISNELLLTVVRAFMFLQRTCTVVAGRSSKEGPVPGHCMISLHSLQWHATGAHSGVHHRYQGWILIISNRSCERHLTIRYTQRRADLGLTRLGPIRVFVLNDGMSGRHHLGTYLARAINKGIMT